MNTGKFGVVLISNLRNKPLLVHIASLWLDLGAEVVVSGPGVSGLALRNDDLKCIDSEPRIENFGDCLQEAIDAVARPFCLTSADDILPVGPGWRGALPLVPGAIQSIRLLSVTGQRWTDWAYWDGKDVFNQPYHEKRSGTYITGGSQLLSPEARQAATYKGRQFHRACDIRFCLDAERAGIRLLPPVQDGPLLVHLDRWPPDRADPERNHVPMRGWLAPAPASPRAQR